MRSIRTVLLIAIFSCISSFAYAQVPSPPANLTLATGGKITLTWTDNSTNELCFPVEVKLPNAVEWKSISCAPQNASVYIDKQFIPGDYCYRVAAFNEGGMSSYSNEACATLNPVKPNPPVLTIGKAPVPGLTFANSVRWTPSDEAVGIHIFRSVSGSNVWGFWDSSYNFAGLWYDRKALVDGVLYCYRAQFWNYGGVSADSNVVCQK